MVKVYSHQDWTGVVIKREATWGTDPGTWTSAAYKVPVVNEELFYDVEIFPPSDEFGALGGLQSVDLGRRSVQGSITVEPTYNTKWWWTLFSQAWGTENLVSDRSIWDDTTAVTDLNTHIWALSGATDIGLSMRVWLGGPGGAGSSHFKLITGLIVTRMTWEQPRGGRARVTFDFIGKTMTAPIGTGETIPAAATATKVKAVDFTTIGGRTNGKIWLGATMASFNTMGFTVTVDRKIELDDNYLQTLNDTNKPGIQGTREVTLEIDTDLEQDFGGAGKPWAEFIAQTVSSASFAYDSGVTAVSPEEYNFRIDLPAIVWTDVRPTLSQAGPVPYRLRATAQMGLVSNLDGSFAEHSIPSGATDIRALCHVTATDDGDAKYSGLSDAT